MVGGLSKDGLRAQAAVRRGGEPLPVPAEPALARRVSLPNLRARQDGVAGVGARLMECQGLSSSILCMTMTSLLLDYRARLDTPRSFDPRRIRSRPRRGASPGLAL